MSLSLKGIDGEMSVGEMSVDEVSVEDRSQCQQNIKAGKEENILSVGLTTMYNEEEAAQDPNWDFF